MRVRGVIGLAGMLAVLFMAATCRHSHHPESHETWLPGGSDAATCCNGVEFRLIPPCTPIAAKVVPAGDGWVHEVKFDGYRVQAHKMGSRVVLSSRNGRDFTERFASIAALLREVPAKAAVLDGEVVASEKHPGTADRRSTAPLADAKHYGAASTCELA